MERAATVDSVIELEIPARAEYVALARLVVSSLASSRRDLPDDRVDDLKVAVSEACTNAIEAHRDAGTDANIVLRCEEHDDVLVVAVEDRGAGFDPDSLPEHPPVTDPQRLNFERGLGIPLIRTLVDDVEIESSSEGTSVRMIMRCGVLQPLDDFDLGDLDAPLSDGTDGGATRSAP
ncbi:MAG TPA: ATP-binding protein [Acidimicrobiales bacterium]|nr:ATP-binding protein [Acidimicrobiales bacterium]